MEVRGKAVFRLTKKQSVEDAEFYEMMALVYKTRI